jgi:coenzyme F420-dependent glucose-6-phosphate dehydrogenase
VVPAIGYTLSSEQFGPLDLVDLAEAAESAGFQFLTISDHFHPWTEQQGQSPFVWSTIGGVSQRVSSIPIGTGVTCPIIRIHPAIVAQAAATSSLMTQGRFFLGLGTGEALNEHITGVHWPRIEKRRAMLGEAIDIIRSLWTGHTIDYAGEHFTLENARIFSVPEVTPKIIVAASGPDTAAFAGDRADGLWSTSANAEVVDAFRSAGGQGPIYGQVTVCVAPTEKEARQTALRVWPTSGMPGQLSQDLPTWTHFQGVSKLVTEDQVADKIVCGPSTEPILEAIGEYVDAGFDHVHLHQIGPDQMALITLFESELKAARREPALESQSKLASDR